LIEIEVVNVGHRSVQIVEAGFVLQNHDFFVPERVALEGEPRVVLPKVLSDGEGLQIYFAVPAIGHGENKAVKVFVEDAEGKRIVASLNDALRVLRQERGSSQ
jgi:hypothetical protein